MGELQSWHMIWMHINIFNRGLLLLVKTKLFILIGNRSETLLGQPTPSPPPPQGLAESVYPTQTPYIELLIHWYREMLTYIILSTFPYTALLKLLHPLQ